MAEQAEIRVDLANLKLTNRDMVDFRREVGKSLMQAFQDADTPEWQADPDFLALAALGWIIGRKDDPALTLDDCLDAEIDATALIQYAKVAQQESNPTPPARQAKGTARRKTS